ncbi:hypothetical protein COHA_009526 [Chlorella ohadii]|uniref:Uncharacterized protein n=1 Tax=Chlorella ohadii TaxID=2649997 RepID=A0AAD5DI63_9CHLO|nr:hypothetical protein COHA_009526 [Chlorella ohadii]
MSWVPPSSSLYEPTSRTAPRPGAAAETFTFGRLPEQGGAAPPAAAAAERNRANFDPDPEQLRWWQQPRNAVTVSGSSNKDIEAWWGSAGAGAVQELVNAGARVTNKAQGLGSSIKASLGDPDEFPLAQAQSMYKSDMTAGHVRVGKRGVCLPPEAMQAYEESRKQAERNKQIGKATNMKLGIF